MLIKGLVFIQRFQQIIPNVNAIFVHKINSRNRALLQTILRKQIVFNTVNSAQLGLILLFDRTIDFPL